MLRRWIWIATLFAAAYALEPSAAHAETPHLTVHLSKTGPLSKGEPVDVMVDYRNVPDGAGLTLVLKPDVAESRTVRA